MYYKILGSEWLTTNMGPSFGVVAIEADSEDKYWKCYMGWIDGDDEKQDEQIVAARGAKLPKEVACAWFPALDPDRWVS